MQQNKIHDHPWIAQKFGFNVNRLGCVMADVDIDAPDFIDRLPEYSSDDPDKFWIKGLVDDHHITVKYGLLPEVTVFDCKSVMGRDGKLEIRKQMLVPCSLEVFPPPPGEDYDCLVLKIHKLPHEFQSMRDALNILPNVDTFSPPTFHVTLGYFERNSATSYLEQNPQGVLRTMFEFTGLSFGKYMRNY